MRILAHIPFFVPDHNDGASCAIYDMFQYLIQKGHECSVLVDKSSIRRIDGIEIFYNDINFAYTVHDIYITHLQKAGMAYNITRELGKPLFHVVHNSYNNSILRVKPNQRAIYNSQWVSDKCQFPVPSIVCRPLIHKHDYITETTGEYITLINFNENKGGKILAKIAAAMPDQKFLAVKGSYGVQQLEQPANVTIIENTNNIVDEVYAKTKILLMPSKYESFGRTAIEAMVSGIPVIANSTPGLIESAGDTAIYVPLFNIDKWVESINFILNEKNYITLSDKSRIQANKICDSDDFKLLENFITDKKLIS